MFKITIIDNNGKKREFNNLPSLIAYANSFQMSWLPDGFSWYIQEPSTDFVDDLEKMKDFFKITKEEFLNSYSYVNEAEYDATAEKVSKENIKFEDLFPLKQYTVKFDCCLWFDKNFMIEARSQQEADQKTKELMGKIEHDMFSSINPKKEPDFEKLKDWTFGDLKFDTVYVQED
jgi:alpha-L-arabinofuranosidase